MTYSNEESMRTEIRRLLSLLDKKYVDGFNRIWPQGVDKIPENRILVTLRLCERSLDKQSEEHEE